MKHTLASPIYMMDLYKHILNNIEENTTLGTLITSKINIADSDVNAAVMAVKCTGSFWPLDASKVNGSAGKM